MFKFPNLKLYRKFLILAVLLCGLCFALAPGKTASAKSSNMWCSPPMWSPCCCSVCLERENECVYNNGCWNFPPGYERDACLYDCNLEQYECRLHCDGLC